MIRALLVLAVLAGAARAEPIQLRVVSPDGSADELAALIAARFEIATDGEDPPALRDAIAAFRAGDCATALRLASGTSAHAQLWRVGITQRCGDTDAARRLAEELDARIDVDLDEFWPSLAELVADARRRTARAVLAGTVRPRGRGVIVAGERGRLRIALASTLSPVTGDPVRALAWLAAQLSPPQTATLGIAVAMLAAGHDVRSPSAAESWHGSGLGSQLALRRRLVVAEADGRVLAYPDLDGWEWGLELRAGAAAHLGKRVALAALAIATAESRRITSTMPFADRDRAALGLAARLELHASARIATLGEIGYLPVATSNGIEVTAQLGVAWRATPAWQLAATFAQDTLKATGSDDAAMRVGLALAYQR